MFKHSTDSASLVVEIEKKNFVRGLGFSMGDVLMGACFHAVLAEVTWPCTPIQWTIFGLMVWNLGYQPSLQSPWLAF